MIKFSYSNSYHSSIDIVPSECLNGRPYQSPLCWARVIDDKLLGPNMVRETSEKISIVGEKVKAAQNRQKSYAKKWHNDLDF